MRILCLANSLKQGGRCLAGIQLHTDNTPLKINNRPQWIRPVGDTDHGQIPTHHCKHVSIRDIFEVDLENFSGYGYQSENYSFNPASLSKVDTYTQSLIPI